MKRMNASEQRPLDGVTVVSLEHAIAAPFCTRQLADLGARVIKVERPGSGDFARGYDERVRGLASHFVWTNRSKESLTLDLKRAEAMAVLERLLGEADVLVQNLAPGAAARMGLSFEALLRRAPQDDAGEKMPSHQGVYARLRRAMPGIFDSGVFTAAEPAAAAHSRLAAAAAGCPAAPPRACRPARGCRDPGCPRW